MRAQCKAAVGFSITGLTRLDPGRVHEALEGRRTTGKLVLAVSGDS